MAMAYCTMQRGGDLEDFVRQTAVNPEDVIFVSVSRYGYVIPQAPIERPRSVVLTWPTCRAPYLSRDYHPLAPFQHAPSPAVALPPLTLPPHICLSLASRTHSSIIVSAFALLLPQPHLVRISPSYRATAIALSVRRQPPSCLPSPPFSSHGVARV